MKIYVDADACPRVAKDVLYNATKREGIDLILVANQYIKTPPNVNIKNIVVSQGADVADDKIVELVEKNDLVITSDIPLADRVIKKSAAIITPKGEVLDEDTISHRLAMRDLMDELRSYGMQTGGPSAYSKQDRQQFVNAIDRYIVRNK